MSFRFQCKVMYGQTVSNRGLTERIQGEGECKSMNTACFTL